MLRDTKFWVLGVAAFLCGSNSTVNAQTPVGTAFTYQGHLQFLGDPVTGNCGFLFRLWDAASAGNQIGPTLSRPIGVSDGHYKATLDFGDGVFDGDARWLEIEVGCGGRDSVILSPRTELAPVPYALFAGEADIGGGNTLDEAYDEGGPGMGGTITADALPVAIEGPYGLTVASTISSGSSITIDGAYNRINSTSDLEFHLSTGRVLRMEPDPIGPNLIGGFPGNTVTPGVIGATIGGGGSAYSGGQPNTVTADFGTVGGGRVNIASGENATVAGGFNGDASGSGATVSGGYNNVASGDSATVGGGSSNLASDQRATVAGGVLNEAGAADAFVGGGFINKANGLQSTVAGGEGNEALEECAFIGGGGQNTATGRYSAVPGGRYNTATGMFSLVAGYRAKANHDGTFVWADSTNADFASTSSDQFLIRATGGVGIGLNNPSEQLDVEGNIRASGTITSGGSITIDGVSNTIASDADLEIHVSSGRALRIEPDAAGPNVIGGYSGNAVAPGVFGATIGGGGISLRENLITDDSGTIGGGRGNQAGDDAGSTNDAGGATVSGGINNIAEGLRSTVGGGLNNTAGGTGSTVAGGTLNTASGEGATVPGGSANAAAGSHSFAAGRRAKANHNGAFVWADSTDADFTSTGDNQFLIRASGNVGIDVTSPDEKLDVDGTVKLRNMPSGGVGTPVYVDANNVLVKFSSSRRYKTAFENLSADADAVLRLRPVRFQWKDTGQKDIGLIAEEVDKVLNDLVVYDGVGRPDAVKYDRIALYLLELAKAQQESIARLQKRSAELRTRLAVLEGLVTDAVSEQEGGVR